MRIKVISILFLFSLIGCAPPIHSRSIESEFSGIVARFKVDALSNGLNIKDNSLVIRFDNVSEKFPSNIGETVGVCQFLIDDNEVQYPSVSIDKEFWNNLDDSRREVLIYHELGHCLLWQDHREHSIMQAILLDSLEYSLHREYYVTELFNFHNV